MKSWRIPVVWQEMAVIDVVANTLKEAVELARDDAGTIPIPENGEYLGGSWEVDCMDIDTLRNVYNDDQEDDVVETKEVIHGYWRPMRAYPDEYVCSECGALWNDEKTKFCHECGATMDAEPEED